MDRKDTALERARMRTTELEHQRRLARKQEKDAQKKLDQRRNFIVGEMVIRAFPELRELEPGSNIKETESNFKPLKDLLLVLAGDRKLVNDLQIRAAQAAESSTEPP